MKKEKQNTKQKLLDVGYQLFSTKGFSAVGLKEILEKAQAPKGSFYHYFGSKVEFGVCLIENYFENYHVWMNEIILNKEKNAKERLLNYFKKWKETQSCLCFDRKCLIVKLSAEITGLSDDMRLALMIGCQSIITKVANCIKEAQVENLISNNFKSQEMAELLYHLWLGASLLNMLGQDDRALQAAFDSTKRLLKK